MNNHKQKNVGKSKVFVANPFRWDQDDIQFVPELKPAANRKERASSKIQSNKSDVIPRQRVQLEPRKKTEEHDRTGKQEHKWVKLGGLGANIGGDEWQISKNKREAMEQFSKKVRQEHHQSIPKSNRAQPLQREQKSSREIGLLYSALIPRPQAKQQQHRPVKQPIESYLQPICSPVSQLQEFEKRHKMLSKMIRQL